MSERNNFNRNARQSLRDRAGNVCSICGIGTSGAEQGGPGVVNIGVAAHITAAAPGGPRYEASLSAEERSHQDNGIWLCQIHGKQIDDDPARFTVEALRTFKREAEARSARDILTLNRRPEFEPAALGREDQAALAALGMVEQDRGALLARLRDAATRDLQAFRRQLKVPDNPAAIRLRLLDSQRSACDCDGLAAALTVFTHVTLVAAPGTGKTTASLLTAERLLAATQHIAIFVPLNEWASQQRPLLDSILRRRAFDRLQERDLKVAAIHGQLTLVLDGWNELDERARRFVRGELQRLMRDFPRIGTLISTRQRSRDVPASGMTVRVEPLDREAQIHVARVMRAEEGVRLLEQARRTPGLRELVSTPLYLITLLAYAHRDQLPQTREEVLRLFVAQHEQIPEHHEVLNAVLAGCHANVLESLAVHATDAGVTALTDTAARAAVRVATDALVAQRQLANAPQPDAVIATLVNHHVLVVPGESGVAFQHQQFQEFYAAGHMERLMRALHAGDQAAARELRTRVFDEYRWEESILFACERLSRNDADGAAATAMAIREALTVDPMLAASMIYRASDAAWQFVANDAIDFARRWRAGSGEHRAVRFMITTGRAEFSDDLWPLIGSDDDQVSFRALRAADEFRGSALGSDWRAQLDRLPVDSRERILGELVSQGDYATVASAARYAAADPSEVVQAGVLQDLLFRRADTLAAEIFGAASDGVWLQLAMHGYREQETGEPALADRLRGARLALDQADVDPRRCLSRLLSGEPRAETADAVSALLRSDEFQMDRDFGQRLVYEAHGRYPDAVVSALLERVERRLPLPWQADEMLRKSGRAIDEGPIPTALLNDIHAQNAETAAAIVGPRTVSRMLELFAELQTRWRATRRDDALHKDLMRVQDLILATNPAAFVSAVLAYRPVTPDDIARTADLLDRHGRNFDKRSPLVSGNDQVALAARLIEWSEVLLQVEGTHRIHLSELAGAMGRLADNVLAPHLLRLLTEEIRRWRVARADFVEARRRGDPANDAQMSYSTSYQRALSDIGGPVIVTAMTQLLPDPSHEGFGLEAAQVLFALWARESGESADLMRRPFAGVRARREVILRGERSPMHPLAQPIFDVIERLVRSPSAADQAHALKLAATAFRLPYGDQAGLIARLLALPQPIAAKQGLLSTLTLAGEVVPAETIIDGVRDLLERARTSPWLLQLDQGGGWELRRWLELLAFSDRPAAVLEVIEMLPEAWRAPWQLESMLSALGDAPDEAAETTLVALAARDPRFAGQHGWIDALAKRKSRTATRALLNVAAQAVGRRGRIPDDHRLAQLVAREFGVDEASRTELRRMYAEAAVPLAQVLERALVESIDEEGVLTLVRRFAAEGRRLDHTLYDALKGMATRHEPSADWQGAFEIVPVSCQPLRNALVDMITRAGPEAALATECLTVIDELRDEHGVPAGETRHPNIRSGLQWPMV